MEGEGSRAYIGVGSAFSYIMIPDVTIIIPTRNRAPLFEEALKSALAQTASDFEVLVLDNASEDETPLVLRRYDVPHLRVIRHCEMLPMQDNWGCGLREARGEFVIFLGDDDLLFPNAVENRLGFARQYRAKAVFSAHQWINEDASRVLKRIPNLSMASGSINRDTALSMALAIEWWIGSTLYDRSRALEIWPRLGPDGTGFDIGINSRIAFRDGAEGRVYCANTVDVSWRQHPKQATKENVTASWELKMRYLSRLREEAPNQNCYRILTRDISNWKTWRGWELSNDGVSRSQSRKFLVSGIKTDPGNIWAWKMMLKCLLSGPRRTV